MNNSQQTTNLCDVKYKIVFLGEMTVGKSSIIQKFTKGIIDQKYQNTVGVDFIAKNVIYKDCLYRLQLWDTAGQERFRSLIPVYMRDSHCAVITYDITNKQSFLRCKEWYEFYKLHKNPQSIALLVGNKTDLTDKREVSYQQGIEMVKNLKQMSFCQLSAKTGKGLQQMFQKVIENIFISKKDLEQGRKENKSQKKENSVVEGGKSESRMNKKTKIEFKEKRRQSACCYI